MATNKNRFSITVDDELYKKIEDFQFERRIKSQSKAVNELMLIGLSALMDNDIKIGPDLNDYDMQLISSYNALDKHGKEFVIEVINKETQRIEAEKRLAKYIDLLNKTVNKFTDNAATASLCDEFIEIINNDKREISTSKQLIDFNIVSNETNHDESSANRIEFYRDRLENAKPKK